MANIKIMCLNIGGLNQGCGVGQQKIEGSDRRKRRVLGVKDADSSIFLLTDSTALT